MEFNYKKWPTIYFVVCGLSQGEYDATSSINMPNYLLKEQVLRCKRGQSFSITLPSGGTSLRDSE